MKKLDWGYMINPRQMAEQLIDDRDFRNLEAFLIELRTYRHKTCEYCGASLWQEHDDRVMHRSCEEVA